MSSLGYILALDQSDPLAIRPSPIEIPGSEFKNYLEFQRFRFAQDAKGVWAYLKHGNLGFLIIEDKKTGKTYLEFSDYTIVDRKITFYPLCSPEQRQYDLVQADYLDIYNRFGLTPVTVDLPDTVTKIPGNLYRVFTRRDGDLDLDFTSNLVSFGQRVSDFTSTL